MKEEAEGYREQTGQSLVLGVILHNRKASRTYWKYLYNREFILSIKLFKTH